MSNPALNQSKKSPISLNTEITSNQNAEPALGWAESLPIRGSSSPSSLCLPASRERERSLFAPPVLIQTTKRGGPNTNNLPA